MSSHYRYKDFSTLPTRLQELADNISIEQQTVNPLPSPSTTFSSSSNVFVNNNTMDESWNRYADEKSFNQPKSVKFSKKVLLQGMEGGSFPATKQVSSQGCSRVFIVKGKHADCCKLYLISFISRNYCSFN
jgi:hypothetical protein